MVNENLSGKRDRRMIWRSSFTSKKLAKCTDSEHLLFYGLILNADDEGRGDGDPLSISLECANRRWSEEQVEGMMKTLRDLRLVAWYRVDDDLFYEVSLFDEGQAGSWQGKHKKTSLIPRIPEVGHRVRCTRTPTSEKSVAKGREGKEREGKESELSDSDLTPKSRFAPGDDPYDLALFLRDLILANDDKAKTPDPDSPAFQKWCLDIDRLIRLDGRPPNEVAAIIHWCQNHHGEKFSWSSNILSANKLRQKYAQLRLQAKEAGASLHFEREQ